MTGERAKMARKTDNKLPSTRSTGDDVAAFVDKLRATPVVRRAGEKGRLIFAIDATASREPTWDRAMDIQAEMFRAAGEVGGLEIQLAFYRGFREFEASEWVSQSGDLLRRMTGVSCLAGLTQISRVLKHALAESQGRKVNALVFVGDVVEENVDALGDLAGQLGLRGVPAFMFQEGGEPTAQRAFQHIAKLTGGAYCPFDASSASQLRDLLSAVAVYAAGGRTALEDYSKRAGRDVKLLTKQVR